MGQWIVGVISFQKIFGLSGLKGHKVEIRWDVTLVHGQRTECEDRARILNRIHNMRFSLLGRLEGLGAGAGAALGRRSYAAQQEQLWSRQRQAHALCVKQGRDLLRRGQFYMK